MAKNTLTRKQARSVEDWLLLDKVWRDIQDRRLSKDDAASLATTALGFSVSAANIESCVAVIGRKWPTTATKKSRAAFQVIALKAALKHIYELGHISAPNETVARVLGLPWNPDETGETQQELPLPDAASQTS